MQFSEIKVQTDACAAAVQRLQAKINDLKTAATAVGDALDALGTTYGGLITDVATAASGSEDVAILNAKAELDLLVAEYQAAKEKVTSVLAVLA